MLLSMCVCVCVSPLSTHSNLVPKSRILELYLRSSTRLHGVVLNEVQVQIYLLFTKCDYIRGVMMAEQDRKM
jgi:hypothetical protein